MNNKQRILKLIELVSEVKLTRTYTMVHWASMTSYHDDLVFFPRSTIESTKVNQFFAAVVISLVQQGQRALYDYVDRARKMYIPASLIN